MSTLSEIITASYSTSRDAELAGKQLKSWLGCDSNYEVARLALGRSLMQESHPGPAPDAKGSPLKGTQLFGSESDASYLWIALLGEQLRLLGQPNFNLENFQQLVRDHWHRGVLDLQQDWQDAGESEAEFISLLARRGAIPEQGQLPSPDLEPDPLSTVPESAGKEALDTLRKTLSELGVGAEIRHSIQGPRITRFTLYMADARDYGQLEKQLDRLEFMLGTGEGVIALAQSSEPQTCLLDLPRKNDEWHAVDLRNFQAGLVADQASGMILPVTPGVGVVGQSVVFDLAEAPHLLVGGTTGSGKSVCLNALMLSLYHRSKTLPIQFALIDPKQVEFGLWEHCGLLFGDIATSMSAAADLLDLLIEEMENRYTVFASKGAKNLLEARTLGYEAGWIVLVVDEMAALVMQGRVGRAIQEKLERLAQKSRASGIHLILATQRPEAETFSGLLRSNCPSRIGLLVQKSSESKIILDDIGAEKLLGKGDMLIKLAGQKLQRSHGYDLRPADIQKHFQK